MNYAVGSLWNKWDLHVHTPASLTHCYKPGAGGDPWDVFIKALAALPPEFKVLGINDYLFVDGYRRVRAAQEAGCLPNLDLILPVVELRLDKFGGTNSTLSKVNFHVIFSDAVGADVIEAQFINRLKTKYVLGDGKVWSAAPTIDSLRTLGKLIQETSPSPERYERDSEDPLFTGWSNLTFSLDAIGEALDASDLTDRYLTAVGKAEWADIKWTGQGVADKKTVINCADAVFVASATPDDYHKAHAALTRDGVNNLLLDCSDSHAYADAATKDRLGNCFTWVKADTTFHGLEHALHEFKDRVFVGDLPPKLRVVADNKTKYIREVRIAKVVTSPLQEDWFTNTDVPFNLDLVAIIGNKGTGKSALADIVGLLGNSNQDRSFSFLREDQFRDPKSGNKAKHFEGTLEFLAGSPITRRLDLSSDPGAPAMVRYLPQNYIEKLCNEIAAGPHTEFDRELKAIIFSHVPQESRLQYSSLDEVINYRTSETKDAIGTLKADLATINEGILVLEAKSKASYRTALEKALAAKNAELAAHDASAPVAVLEPAVDPDTEGALRAIRGEVVQKRERQNQLVIDRSGFANAQTAASQRRAAADKVAAAIDNLSEEVSRFGASYATELQTLGLAPSDVVTYEAKRAVLTDLSSSYETEVETLGERIKALDAERIDLDSSITSLTAQLDEPTRRYQDYLSTLQTWQERRSEIVGAETTPGTVENLNARLAEIPELPALLADAVERRRDAVRAIWKRISALADVYREMYAAVQDFIDGHAVAREKFQLRFHVAITDRRFKDRFFDFINRGVVGTFCGVDESERIVATALGAVDFSNEDDVVGFVDAMLARMHFDMRGGTQPYPVVEVDDQLRKGHSAVDLYNFVSSLDYLEPQYSLRMGTKEVSVLSPGEKGALLLVFYLLVDKGDIPLIVDQPEGNLDNETVVDLLVPCIKEARKRRQIIIVTHNPNIAVVCDADQIIWASLDKAHSYRVSYVCGALENPTINKKVVDILEGTQPAFDNRDRKYLRVRTSPVTGVL
jgi:ABC-type lipoprotein export system ATPase subunit